MGLGSGPRESEVWAQPGLTQGPQDRDKVFLEEKFKLKTELN